MEKAKDPSLFVNDGSFMERFKQLQQEKDKEKGKGKTDTELKSSKVASNLSGTSSPKLIINKTSFALKGNESRKPIPAPSGGKLAFSLKQKSKIVAPSVKLGEDEDENEKDAGNPSGDAPSKRQKLDEPVGSVQSLRQFDVAPPPPSDPTVKKVADKLASFVAKNGRQFEHITRQKNPGDTPFKFLFDESCPDYKYYEYRLGEEEKALSQTTDSQTAQSGGTKTSTPSLSSGSQRSYQQRSNYQIPASALYGTADASREDASTGRYGEPNPPTAADPIAMMEFYMKKAAEEEKLRPFKSSKDEMPPPPSLQVSSGKKGHHMGDYIPPEELAKFMANCNDAAAQKATKEIAERNKIQANNIGHKLLSKMGWREGEGLGSSRSGIADPITAGDVKSNNLGVGAHNPGEVTPEDDIYEQYKKRMMLGYRYRPNPLNNPRKSYY
nr:SURP and G-patch domain-containing protein 1-like protein [Ipomoea trifida]